jgi:pyruvate dehydrogenase E2 component (dihydrolipoamide acetyltransferase)
MDLKLPHLGEGADSGTVVNLFVKEGDHLAKDQAVLELENEKAVATIPSTAEGTVTKIFVKTGEKISVGQRILSLDEKASEAAPKAGKTEAAQKKKATEPKSEEPETDEEREAAPKLEEAEAEKEPAAKPGIPSAASPSIRKLARDLGIDLTRVRGSESGGRIILADVRAYIQKLQSRPAGGPSKPGAAAPAKPAEQVDFSKWGPVTKQPLSPLRQVIARRMSENWNTIPHVTQFDNADITDLVELRKKYASVYEEKGARLTLTSFALKIVASVLKTHPGFRSSLDESSQEIVQKEYYHISVAVDTEAGLIVPVIRDVDKKSVFEVSKELEDLAKKARDRKVSAEDLKGGVFTISNQGGIGGAHFTPIINKPEVAILGLGRGSVQAVVRQNKVEPRLMLPIALSYDHRVIDGGAAARFTVDLVKAVETFKEEDVKL